MNNFEYIQGMSVEEFAKWWERKGDFDTFCEELCPFYDHKIMDCTNSSPSITCEDARIKWLKEKRG